MVATNWFKCGLFFFFLFSFECLQALDNKLPEPQALDGMDTLWIAENIKYNGVPARIKTFYSSDAPKELLRKYESKWKAEGLAEKTLQKMGDLQILGIESRGVFFSVQVRPARNGGSEGSLVVSQTPIDAEPDVTTKFPLPSKSQIMMKLESDDLGQQAETLTVTSGRSISSLSSWYQHEMREQGWAIQDFGIMAQSSALFFQKGNQICQISFAKGGQSFPHKSVITINWMK